MGDERDRGHRRCLWVCRDILSRIGRRTSRDILSRQSADQDRQDGLPHLAGHILLPSEDDGTGVPGVAARVVQAAPGAPRLDALGAMAADAAIVALGGLGYWL